MDWFKDCTDVQQIKKLYRKLALENHPDHGGDEDTMKAVTAAMESALERLVRAGVDGFAQEKGYSPNVDTQTFAHILRDIIELNITIEIIGFWIYVFDSFEEKDRLKEMGFWFSRKHKAWVYSGRKKTRTRTGLSTDEIRNLHGSEQIKERRGDEHGEKDEHDALPA